MKELISVSEALQIVLENVRSTGSESVSLAEALGRTLAEDLTSRDDIPPFTNSAMDGFAVRTSDLEVLPKLLPVIEDVFAGSVPLEVIQPGTCSRIMTGAPVPDGADAVVPVEWTREPEEGLVIIERAPLAGQYVRLSGEDVRAGDTVIPSGSLVSPPTVGMMASLGYAHPRVARRPTVSVVSTGDELVEVTADLTPGTIRDSNGPALAAQAVAAGADVLRPFRARDDLADIRRVVEAACETDVILFSGGVSVGSHDFVKRVLNEAGMQILFWRVRQRPGKPLAFGLLRDSVVFGLPGNPVSSAICFDRYVRPALAVMMGRRTVHRRRAVASLEKPTPKSAGLHWFARGIARYDETGELLVRDTGPQASNLYSSVALAECLIHLPEHLERADKGTRVEIEWLTW